MDTCRYQYDDARGKRERGRRGEGRRERGGGREEGERGGKRRRGREGKGNNGYVEIETIRLIKGHNVNRCDGKRVRVTG